MSEEFSFVQQIREDPRDDTPRLIYADFLDDAGDPQGELIRVQVELSHLPVGDERRVPLVQRETELLTEHGEAWLAPLRKLGVQGASVRCFQRGLIERAKISAGRFLEVGDALCDIAPALYCVELLDVLQAAARVAEFDMPSQITALDLSAKQLKAMQLGMLRGASWMDQIESLNLAANRLGDDGVEILVGREFAKLESLNLNLNQLGPEAALSLATWSTLANLKRLSLSVNQLGDAGAQRLAGSRLFAQLERLDLASNQIGDDGARRLAEATRFSALSELNLRSNRIGVAGMQAFANGPLRNQVAAFDVRGNPADGIEALQQTLPEGILQALP